MMFVEPVPSNNQMAFKQKEMTECEMCEFARLHGPLGPYCWLKNYRHGRDDLPVNMICDEPYDY